MAKRKPSEPKTSDFFVNVASPIRDMFDALVPEYDRFNRLSSLGLDILWRKEVSRVLGTHTHILDVGTGTGDLAKQLSSQSSMVTGVDFSTQMIAAARGKLTKNANIHFEVGSADSLPFESGIFSGLTSAFVIRNLHHAGILTASLKEFYRVLQPGGQMVHLELTQPHNPMMLLGYKTYMKTILPSIGWAMFGSRWPKNYLNKTIENLPPTRTVCQWMRWAGFDRICHYPLSKGIASLFVGWKPNA